MKGIIRLRNKSLPHIPRDVAVPSYDRSGITAGIVHIGMGSFHRAHQAYYTDELLKHPDNAAWGICGVDLPDTDCGKYNNLARQDGLYTLLVPDQDGRFRTRIIGSIVECLFGPGNPEAVIAKIADPAIRVVTLTITEGGYNSDPSTGEFMIKESPVQWDLKNPEKPITVFGYLTQALKRRMESGTAGLTLQSCDDMIENGNVLRRMLLSYVSEAEPGLAGWIEREVAFPNSVSDRITSPTRLSDIEYLKSAYGIDDPVPVLCEPYIQWVSEDRYSNGRPPWESAGVRFVSDIGRYEKMKSRLLNAGHSLLGFSGTLYGCRTIDESIRVPLLGKFFRKFMDDEVTPLLDNWDKADIDEYKRSLVTRLSNKNIEDQLTGICSESSLKVRRFLLPTINEQLERGGPVKCGAIAIAAWCRCLELAGSSGTNVTMQDQMGSLLQEKALASAGDDPLAFLRIGQIFGGLADSERFVDTYMPLIDALRRNDIEKVIMEI